MNFDINVTIVGMGLIGGSYGLSLKRVGFKNVIGVDIDKSALEKALDMKAIDKSSLDLKEVLPESDIVIFSVYPQLTQSLIIENMEHFKSGAIISDAAGIKEKLLEEILPFLRKDIDFIPAHPMAGKESKGIDLADPDIFIDANFIITPIKTNNPKNIALLKEIVKAMGFKNIIETDPSTHDENIAYVSQLPHIVAVGMVNCKQIENVNMFAGGSYRDTTRIAKINADLWSELFIENKKHLVEQIDLFLNYTKSIRDAIDQENIERLKCMLSESHDRKGDDKYEDS